MPTKANLTAKPNVKEAGRYIVLHMATPGTMEQGCILLPQKETAKLSTVILQFAPFYKETEMK